MTFTIVTEKAINPITQLTIGYRSHCMVFDRKVQGRIMSKMLASENDCRKEVIRQLYYDGVDNYTILNGR